MKKRLFACVLAVLLIVCMFSGCGNSANYDSASPVDAPAAENSSAYAMDSGYYYDADEYYAEAEVPAPAEGKSGSGMIGTAAKIDPNPNKKIIYTAYATVETIDFEKTIESVYAMLDTFGAYIESSSITGADYASTYYNSFPYRNAYFSIRVPKEHYTEMSEDLDTLGNLTAYSSDSNDITARYYDTETRLAAVKTEHERLLEMMAAAETVEDMIAVESRLSEVEYEIDSLTGTLRVWQDEVDYSTINLSINEVRELSEVPAAPPITFGERIVTALTDSFEWLGEALQDIAVFIVGAIPVLIIPAVIIVAVILIIKFAGKRKRAKIAAAYAARKQQEEQTGNDK